MLCARRLLTGVTRTAAPRPSGQERDGRRVVQIHVDGRRGGDHRGRATRSCTGAASRVCGPRRRDGAPAPDRSCAPRDHSSPRRHRAGRSRSDELGHGSDILRGWSRPRPSGPSWIGQRSACSRCTTSPTIAPGGGRARRPSACRPSKPCAGSSMDAPLLPDDFKEFSRLLNATGRQEHGSRRPGPVAIGWYRVSNPASVPLEAGPQVRPIRRPRAHGTLAAWPDRLPIFGAA